MLKPYRSLLVSIALFATAITSSSAAARTNEYDTTVCKLYATLSSPPPGRVHIKAIVYKGPRHGAILTDPQCPGKTIGLRLPDHIVPGSSVAKFNAALTGDVMDLSLRIFEVEVSGVVKAANPSQPDALFMVDHVDHFKKRDAAPSPP